jgi:hypothetical protein
MHLIRKYKMTHNNFIINKHIYIYIYYFTYGSNLNPNILLRIKIIPVINIYNCPIMNISRCFKPLIKNLLVGVI